jgi:hypothetical protein
MYEAIFDRMAKGEAVAIAGVAKGTARTALQRIKSAHWKAAADTGITMPPLSVHVEEREDGCLVCSLAEPKPKGFASKLRIVE